MGASVSYNDSGTMTVMLEVHGEPVAQGRPRFSSRGKFVKAYDPEKSRTYKQTLRLYAQDVFLQMPSFKPFDTAINVNIVVRRSIPKSFSKKARAAALSGDLRPITKPDAENYSKGICDALNGILWTDDSRITDLHVHKIYSDNPGVEVYVTGAPAPEK